MEGYDNVFASTRRIEGEVPKLVFGLLQKQISFLISSILLGFILYSCLFIGSWKSAPSSDSVKIEGSILEKRISKKNDNNQEYLIKFDYVINGKTQRGMDTISKDTYSKISSGDPVSVIYDPIDQTSRTEFHVERSFFVFYFLSFAFTVIGFISLIFTLKNKKEITECYDHGNPVFGKIKSCSNNRSNYTISYLFSINGKIHTGETSYDSKNNTNPELEYIPKGTIIVVIVHPTNNNISTLWKFCWDMDHIPE
ncbi:hypothetical protein KAJ27_11830 [bacterium]|nr:hypothetical protein [bacterium]